MFPTQTVTFRLERVYIEVSRQSICRGLLTGLLIVGSGNISICVFSATVNAQTTNPPSAGNPRYTDSNSPVQVPNQSGSSDVIGDISGVLNGIEGVYQDRIGQISGVVGRIVGIFRNSSAGSFLSDVNEIANLVIRLINFPSQIGGWWDDLVGSVTGELDPCLPASSSIPTTPPFVYEPGWCIGGSSGDLGNLPGENSGDPSDGDIPGDGDPSPHNPHEPSGGHVPGGSSGQTPGGSSGQTPGGRTRSLGQIMRTARGAAGIPIPSEMRRLIEQTVDSTAGNDVFEVSPRVVKHYLGNTAERGLTRLAVESTLSELGQQKMNQEMEGIQAAATNSIGAAVTAQRLNVTQDVMKQIAQMQAQETLLLGSLASSSQQSRIDNNLTNLNLSNISRSLDEANRNRRIDSSLNSRKLLFSVAQSSLY